MPFLVILKRFEVWLLIAVVFALLAFAFRPEPASLPQAGGDTPTKALPGVGKGESDIPNPDAPKEIFAVEEVKVTPTKGGMIVELTLSGRSPSGTDLALDESSVTATTDEGEPVNRYFEPFREPAVLLASGGSVATLKWWLERPADAIWLDLHGERVKAELP
jgi:hypothetical protein